MKQGFVIITLTLLLTYNTKAQIKKMLFMQLSTSQIEIGFQHQVLKEKFWADLYVGIGNQDINSKFDDFTSGFGIGYIAFSNPKNQISIHTGIGVYIPNNDYYSVTVPLINAGTQYTRFLDKKEKHCLFFNAGYRYGKNNYEQEYLSDMIKVSTMETFKISPLNISIGYGFRFY